MQETLNTYGIFWDLRKPDKKVFGFLKISFTEGTYLELKGTHGFLEGYNWSNEFPVVEYVQGVILSNKIPEYYLLKQAHVVSLSNEGHKSIGIRPEMLYKSNKEILPEDLYFMKAFVEFQLLDKFFHYDAILSHSFLNESEQILVELLIEYNSYKIYKNISLDDNWSHSLNRVIKQNNNLRIDFNPSIRHDEDILEDIISRLQLTISLIWGFGPTIRSIGFTTVKGDAVELIQDRQHQTTKDFSSVFELERLGDSFDTIYRAIELKGELELVYKLWQSNIIDIIGMSDLTEFLNYVFAIDTFYAKRYLKSEDLISNLQKQQTALLRFLKDHGKDEWLGLITNEMKLERNNISLGSKLSYLLEGAYKLLKNDSIKYDIDFISKVVSLRHKLVHGSQREAPEYEEANALKFELKRILRALLLRDFGVSDKMIRKIIFN